MKTLYVPDDLYNEFFETIVEKFKNGAMTKEKLLDFGFEYDDYRSIQNTEYLGKLLEYELVPFNDIVDRFKEKERLKTFIHDDLFEALITDRNLIGISDLMYVFDSIEQRDAVLRLLDLSTSSKLLERAFDNCLISNELFERYDLILGAKDAFFDRLDENLSYADEQSTANLRKFVKIYKFIQNSNLDANQKDEVLTILKNNSAAQNKLSYLIDTNLEETLDFESLQVHLKKSDRKNALNI